MKFETGYDDSVLEFLANLEKTRVHNIRMSIASDSSSERKIGRLLAAQASKGADAIRKCANLDVWRKAEHYYIYDKRSAQRWLAASIYQSIPLGLQEQLTNAQSEQWRAKVRSQIGELRESLALNPLNIRSPENAFMDDVQQTQLDLLNEAYDKFDKVVEETELTTVQADKMARVLRETIISYSTRMVQFHIPTQSLQLLSHHISTVESTHNSFFKASSTAQTSEQQYLVRHLTYQFINRTGQPLRKAVADIVHCVFDRDTTTSTIVNLTRDIQGNLKSFLDPVELYVPIPYDTLEEALAAAIRGVSNPQIK